MYRLVFREEEVIGLVDVCWAPTAADVIDWGGGLDGEAGRAQDGGAIVRILERSAASSTHISDVRRVVRHPWGTCRSASARNGSQRLTWESGAWPRGWGVVAARPRRRPGPRYVLSSGGPWSLAPGE
ncbi:hypothetical protein NDU88_000863 [Pleurodeles waltl]|uniref:Uncharacterized protein n=1 Tax=Pleurodeles waltl TaxID=8319 RepID=A0AAV7WLW9_PLEWA|nr:hypothetical protein NDU88_000863 [Pleurodeles waltl]